MLSDYEIGLFRRAAQSLKLWDSVRTYLDLRDLFADPNKRNEFEQKFARYYGLRAAGLTEAWLKRYFELLFDYKKIGLNEPYQFLLLDLFNHKRRRGDKVLQFSFVSKLVAFHDETRPLYDQRVRHFFGLGPPKFGANEFKIAGFIENLNEIARRYMDWVKEEEFAAILNQMRERYPALNGCHQIRLCDFLVHKASA
jgi:hypothetical protein